MVYGSNPPGKDNPRSVSSYAAETLKAAVAGLSPPRRPGMPEGTGRSRAASLSRLTSLAGDSWWGTLRLASGLATSWLRGLPRRAGRRLFAMNDAEARWQRWQVAEPHGGLGRQYRDQRFHDLRRDDSLRRDEVRGGALRPQPLLPPDAGQRRDGGRR